jgi:uncharacterized phage protein gp47/JayE
MPTFPLATLAAQITATGITAPAYVDILSSLIASFQAIYGSDVLLTPDTQDYQLLAVFALAINDANQAAIAIYNGFLPSAAQGVALSNLVRLNGISRNIATNSIATVTIVGVAGTVITNGAVQDANGNVWQLPLSVTIPGPGTIDVTATAQLAGALSAGIGTINKIFTPVQGWQSVTNAAAATPGAAVETDAALRSRQAVSTSLPAQTPLQSIIAAVANVTGVTRYTIYENPTNATDSNGLPAHSISVVVLGGADADIAGVIEAKKSPGTGTFGSTSIVVNDPSGVPITINFYHLAQVNIYVSITIKAQTGYLSTTQAAIVTAIVNFINSLPIGASVRYNWLITAASLSGLAAELTFYVTALTVGTAPGPSGTVDVPITFNQAAVSDATKIVVTVT